MRTRVNEIETWEDKVWGEVRTRVGSGFKRSSQVSDMDQEERGKSKRCKCWRHQPMDLTQDPAPRTDPTQGPNGPQVPGLKKSLDLTRPSPQEPDKDPGEGTGVDSGPDKQVLGPCHPTPGPNGPQAPGLKKSMDLMLPALQAPDKDPGEGAGVGSGPDKQVLGTCDSTKTETRRKPKPSVGFSSTDIRYRQISEVLMGGGSKRRTTETSNRTVSKNKAPTATSKPKSKGAKTRPGMSPRGSKPAKVTPRAAGAKAGTQAPRVGPRSLNRQTLIMSYMTVITERENNQCKGHRTPKYL